MKTLVTGSGKMVGAITLILLFGALAGCGGSTPDGNLLTDHLSEPLNGVTTAKVDINCGAGHLTIDGLTGDEPLLAAGLLQYLEQQGPPTRTLSSLGDQAALTLQGSGGTAQGSGFRWPWQACAGGAYAWQIHLNPTVATDIAAHSDGGNVKLDLAGMAVTHVSADTGGGNIDVVLPDKAAELSVTAKTGAGNVTVLVPSGIRVEVHATSGLGKVIVDPQFSKIDEDTYQSPGYDGAANRVEITLSSGAGNVTVKTQ